MSVTPQTNTDLATIAQFLLDHDDYVICGHVNPDGDCVGSQLGLAAALRLLGKQVSCLLVKNEPPDPGPSFLPGFTSFVPAVLFEGKARTFVAVDVPNRERIGQAAAAILDGCEASVTIDHHAVDTTMTNLVYVDPDVPAVTLLIWQLAEYLGVDRSNDIAQCCYTGLISDTGNFQFQNTNSEALRLGAEMIDCGAQPAAVSSAIFQSRSVPSIRLESRAIEHILLGSDGKFVLSWLSLADFNEFGATKSDAEPIIDSLRTIAGVRVACLLRERDGEVRGSLRAKDDTDVAALARKLGGGGHRAAAGFTFYGTLNEARATLETELVQLVSDCTDAVQ